MQGSLSQERKIRFYFNPKLKKLPATTNRGQFFWVKYFQLPILAKILKINATALDSVKSIFLARSKVIIVNKGKDNLVLKLNYYRCADNRTHILNY